MPRKKLKPLVLILVLVLMPLNVWSKGVYLGVKTESGLLIEYLKEGQKYIAPENGYFVNEPWMETSDEALIEGEDMTVALKETVDRSFGNKTFWFGVGILLGGIAGVVIAK